MRIKNSNTKLLLKYIAIGGAVVALSLMDYRFPRKLLKAYIRKRKFQKGLFLQDLRRLQKRELIDYKELPDGKVKISLKSNGKKKILQYEIDDMKIVNRKWDGNWRVIMFDIPDKKRKASNAISQKLKDLGFYRLQKSVYIFPFACEDEIEFITTIFDVNDHILILKIPKFAGSEKIAHYYKIGE